MPYYSLSVLHAQKQHRSAGSAFVLHVPEFRLRAGSVTVVAGRSGCGKTTLLDVLGCISSFSRCEDFRLCLDGEKQVDMLRLGAMGKAHVRRFGLGYVLQQGGLMGDLTAWENIELTLRMSGRMHLAAEAREMAEELGVAAELHKFPHALSVGQRQRMSVVRALANQPPLLLADEPTGALDPITAQQVCGQLVRAARKRGCTVVVVTHDVELFAPLADVQYGFRLESDESGVVHSTLVRQIEQSEEKGGGNV